MTRQPARLSKTLRQVARDHHKALHPKSASAGVGSATRSIEPTQQPRTPMMVRLLRGLEAQTYTGPAAILAELSTRELDDLAFVEADRNAIWQDFQRELDIHIGKILAVREELLRKLAKDERNRRNRQKRERGE